jgi:uncharacterized protein (PEP-CTERM system associated)
MATTVRPKADRSPSNAARTRRRSEPKTRVSLAFLVSAGFAAPAMAERWQLDTGVDSQLLWTSNSDFGLSSLSREDTVVQVRPRVSIHGEGARLRVSGTASLDAIDYVNHTQDSRVQPKVDLTARLEAVERLFFIDTAYRASQTSENPFAVRPETGSTANTVTTTEARFSPYIEGIAPGELRYNLRADNSWVREIGAAAGASTTAGYFGNYSASIERPARPLGWRLEAERSYTRYEDETLPTVALSQARAAVNYQLVEGFRVGVRVGAETNNLTNVVERHRTSGVEVHWQPSPRTTLNVSRDDRFFGAAWQLNFNHRMPKVAWNINLSRNIDTTPQALFNLPATANVTALLDAMFTTRYPDPVERARVVQDLINRRGLPTSTQGPITLLNNSVSLVTRREVGVAFNGARNSLALTAYHVRTEDATDTTNSLSTGTAFGNNIQYGASLLFSQRLTPSLGVNVTLDRSRIHALDTIGTDRTVQSNVNVQLNLQASPKTNAYAGGRYRKIDSNTVAEGKEGAVFVGLDHRF